MYTSRENAQNDFRLHRDMHLGLCIGRTLQAAHVKVDLHAKNVPIAFLSSKILGEKDLARRLSLPLRCPRAMLPTMPVGRACRCPGEEPTGYGTRKGREDGDEYGPV